MNFVPFIYDTSHGKSRSLLGNEWEHEKPAKLCTLCSYEPDKKMSQKSGEAAFPSNFTVECANSIPIPKPRSEIQAVTPHMLGLNPISQGKSRIDDVILSLPSSTITSDKAHPRIPKGLSQVPSMAPHKMVDPSS